MKYLLIVLILFVSVRLHSLEFEIIMGPLKATSSTGVLGKQDISGTAEQEKLRLSFDEAKFSTTLKDLIADMIVADSDSDDEDSDSEIIKIPIKEDTFSKKSIEIFVALLKKIHEIKTYSITKLNNAQILDELGVVPVLIENKLQLLKVADFYNVPLLWQAIARWYVKKGTDIISLKDEITSLRLSFLFINFAEEYYRQYWLIKKELPQKPADESLIIAYNEFGVSVQELLDNGHSFLDGVLVHRRINSLVGLLNIPNVKTFRKLDLSSNKLTTLPAGIFTGLTALQELDLSSNQLTTLPAGIFTGLTALQYLYLSSNKLTTLPAGIFTGLTALQKLHLSGNQLTRLPGWKTNLGLTENVVVV